MRKLFHTPFFAAGLLRAALFSCLISAAPALFAQQLFIDHMDVTFTNNTAVCPTSAGTSRSWVTTAGENQWANSSLIEFGQMQGNYTSYNTATTPPTPINTTVTHGSYPGGCLTLCADIKCVSDTTFGIDEMRFEVFKFKDGTNPLDSGSAPPIRTFFNYNISSCDVGVATESPNEYDLGTYCTAWDASYNIRGEFGRTNGQFGYRATVKTNYATETANISIEQTSAFPGQQQIPIQVDVVDIHTVQSTPSVVGSTTPVAAAPYNIIYRLSKDANVSIAVYAAGTSEDQLSLVRLLLNDAARVGEGTPDGTLQNGDTWDGRDWAGRLLPAGNYVLQIDAHANDEFGEDHAFRAHRQISIDPLQMTDFAVRALDSLSTSQAYIRYVLTESATVYTRIYNPDCHLTNVNSPGASGPAVVDAAGNPATAIRSLTEQQTGRTVAYSYWDGRNDAGDPIDDGDYLVVQWAEIPNGHGGSIYTSKFYQRVLSVSRGYVDITGPLINNTAMGSSPTVAGLDPFTIAYLLSRDALTTVNIRTSSGTLVRELVSNEARVAASGGTNMERWDGKDDNGYYVSSGVYMAEIAAADFLMPSRISRRTTLFPVDMFRITDVSATPLPNGTTEYAEISFALTQSMYARLEIYEPGTVIPTNVWPPAISSTPVKVFEGTRPGRRQTTIAWDGIYNDTMARDGEYVFALVAYSSAPMRDYSTGNIVDQVYPTDRVVGKISVVRGPVYFNNVEIIPTIPEMAASSESVKLPPYEIKFEVPRMASVTIQAVNTVLCLAPKYKNNVCRNIEPGAVFSPGMENSVYWDGRDDYGDYLYADAYTIQLIAYNYPNPALQPSTTWYEVIEMNPFQIYDMGISDISSGQPYGSVSYQASVPMKVAIQIFKPGTTLDVNGNPSPPLAQSLVKAIVGVRPPFSPVSELWDGTDRSLTPVPDGLYVFRIVTATDTALIDSVTGAVSGNNKQYIADLGVYITPNVLAVSKGEDADACGSFQNTTSFYPNPLRQSSGTFRITRVPVPGYYSFKLYNLPGDLVYEYDWGYQVPGSVYPNLEHIWRRENASGNKVARGVYFAVMELKSTQGNRQVCQTVKKILVP